jgi:GNAT superfamily N-acetyltransferase
MKKFTPYSYAYENHLICRSNDNKNQNKYLISRSSMEVQEFRQNYSYSYLHSFFMPFTTATDIPDASNGAIILKQYKKKCLKASLPIEAFFRQLAVTMNPIYAEDLGQRNIGIFQGQSHLPALVTSILYHKRLLKLATTCQDYELKLNLLNFTTREAVQKNRVSVIALPALFRKNLLFRPTISPEEIVKFYEICVDNQIHESFYESIVLLNKARKENSDFNSGEIPRLRFIGGGVAGKTLLGGAYFVFFKEDNKINCKIEALWIDPDHKNYGLGTLLMSYIIFEAIEMKCEKVSVFTGDHLLDLTCTHLGFMHERAGKNLDDSPKTAEQMRDWIMLWNNLTVLQKTEFCQKNGGDLFLYLSDSSEINFSEVIVQNLLQKVKEALDAPIIP